MKIRAGDQEFDLEDGDWERLQATSVVTLADTSGPPPPAAPTTDPEPKGTKPSTPDTPAIDSIDTSWDANDNPVGGAEGDGTAEGDLPDPQGPCVPFGPSPFIFEGTPTSDGRIIEPGALTTRPLPHTFMLMTETNDKHKGARVQGRIDKWEKQGDVWMASGLYVGYVGQEGAELARSKVMAGVSGDIAATAMELRVLEVDDDGLPTSYQEVVTKGEIMGATQTPFPAFAEAMVDTIGEVVEGDEGPTAIAYPNTESTTFVASAAPVAPPLEWFANPNLSEPTPLTVTDDGQVFGHVASWGVCHIGRDDVCLTAPSSPSNYSYFCTGEIRCADGTRVPVGQLTFEAGHAETERPIGYQMAMAHYDNTATAAADVNCGEDEHGIWVAGAMRPHLTDEQRREFAAAAPSGDWREIRGNLEMVACLMVNVQGFPIPRPRATLVASIVNGQQEWREVALVAAAAPQRRPGQQVPTPTPLPRALLELAARYYDAEVLGATFDAALPPDAGTPEMPEQPELAKGTATTVTGHLGDAHQAMADVVAKASDGDHRGAVAAAGKAADHLGKAADALDKAKVKHSVGDARDAMAGVAEKGADMSPNEVAKTVADVKAQTPESADQAMAPEPAASAPAAAATPTKPTPLTAAAIATTFAYTKAQRDEMAKNGQAKSDGSFPIKTAKDLKSAIGLARSDSDRAHVVKRAKALGKSDQIPDEWNADGSHK